MVVVGGVEEENDDEEADEDKGEKGIDNDDLFHKSNILKFKIPESNINSSNSMTNA